MSADFEVRTAALERLSALVDGELDADATTQACALWRESVVSRATWHAYQLIGDVLRSDDLARDPVRDAVFMRALSARLAAEPAVLSPQALESQPVEVVVPSARSFEGAPRVWVANGVRNRRWAWLAPSAVAAGFAAVAGLVMLARTPDIGVGLQPGVSVAGAASANLRVMAPTLAAAAGGAGEPQTFVASGAVIRDARLDRYLAAHMQFAGTSALGVPSAFLRSATVSGSDR